MDDLVVFGVENLGELLEDLINPVIENIERWITNRWIQLAQHKTEAPILTKTTFLSSALETSQ